MLNTEHSIVILSDVYQLNENKSTIMQVGALTDEQTDGQTDRRQANRNPKHISTVTESVRKVT